MGEALGVFTLVVCLSLWGWAAWRWRRGRTLLAYEARPPRYLGLLDVLGFFVLLGAADLLAVRWAAADSTELLQTPPDQWPAAARVALIRLSGFTRLAAACLTLLVLAVFRGSSVGRWWKDWIRRAPHDVAVGLVGFLMIVPPVLLLQSQLTRWSPSQHPLIELIREHPETPTKAAAAFSAVVVAPLVEELLFRGLLLSWLLRLTTGRDEASTLILGGRSEASGRPKTGEAPDANGTSDSRSAAGLAIAGSSLAFALLHVSHGPDWIPLFFLALGLGLLAYRTGRLTASIVVHVLLNLWSISLLFSGLAR